MNTYTNEQLSHTNSSSGRFLAGVFLGGLAGALTMLFLAPQSGKETRQQLQQRTMELRDQATLTVENTLTQVRNKADQLKTNLGERASSLKQQGQDVVENTLTQVRTKADQLKQQGQDVLVDQLDRVSTAAENSKKLIQGNGKQS